MNDSSFDQGKFYDLLAYIATTSKEMYVDPQIYAPMRLLSVMLRLIEMVETDPGLDTTFLGGIRQLILDNRSFLLTDRARFGDFLDQLILHMAMKNFSQ